MMSSTRMYPTLIILGLLLAVLSGCSSGSADNPKDTVIAFFGAMEKDDEAALAHLLDLAELMRSTNTDYALNSDSARVFTSPTEMLKDLTGEGKTKMEWFSYQRIVNETQVNGDVATVEVTFNDKARGVAYLTKFGLHKVNGKWKIYSFKTEGGA